MDRRMATYVRYASGRHCLFAPVGGHGSSSIVPSPYCPRVVLLSTSSLVKGCMAWRIFVCSSRTASASNDGRLHRGQGDQLENVVRDHVAQGPALIVAAARLHSHGFRDGDLHVPDVAAVPDGLKDAVGETEHQDVLHGLFAEVVVDAVDLLVLEVISRVAGSAPWPTPGPARTAFPRSLGATGRSPRSSGRPRESLHHVSEKVRCGR